MSMPISNSAELISSTYYEDPSLGYDQRLLNTERKTDALGRHSMPFKDSEVVQNWYYQNIDTGGARKRRKVLEPDFEDSYVYSDETAMEEDLPSLNGERMSKEEVVIKAVREGDLTSISNLLNSGAIYLRLLAIASAKELGDPQQIGASLLSEYGKFEIQDQSLAMRWASDNNQMGIYYILLAMDF